MRKGAVRLDDENAEEWAMGVEVKWAMEWRN